MLREGNSDRRVAKAVKEYARNNPYKMEDWTQQSRSHVSHMDEGDFYGSEKSLVMEKAKTISIRLRKSDGKIQILKKVPSSIGRGGD